MWLELCFAIISCIFLLYVPGLIGAASWSSRIDETVAFAPIISVTSYCFAGLVLSLVGVFASAATIIPFALAWCLAVYLVGRLIRRPASPRDASLVGIVVVYVCIAILVSFFVFILPLDGPGSFVQTYDNVHQYGTARTFLISGDWSPFNSSLYSVPSGEAPVLDVVNAFYPSGWHTVVAVLASLTGLSLSLCANAFNFVVLAVIFPIAAASFIACIFNRDREKVLLGAFVTPICAAFPWMLMESWPLFPNALSFSAGLGIVCAFVGMLADSGTAKDRIAYGIMFIIGIVACFFMQPNTVFSLGAMLVPFCIWRACKLVALSNSCRKHGPLVASLLCGIAIVLIWLFAFNLPFMQPVVQYHWAPITTLPGSIKEVLLAGYPLLPVNIVLAALVFIGFVRSCRNAETVWMAISYLFCALLYIVSASMEPSFIKQLLTGFWYTDAYRVASVLAMAGLPLAVLGACDVRQFIVGLGCARNLDTRTDGITAVVPGRARAGISLLVVVLMCAVSFVPFIVLGDTVLQGPFGFIATSSESHNTMSDSAGYSLSESSFVKKAMAAVPEGETIINMPYDGSMFAYSIDDAPVVFRTMEGYGSKGEDPDSVLIREALCDISWRQDVRDAVESTHAGYVLILERDPDKADAYYTQHHREQWTGITSIADDTPGFEVVLKDGDMRLYRILV